jgi:CRISPR-associated protein Cmr3
MIIEIEALDTLFFRDGKPFEKSDDVWATGMFPPLPSVIYGALRSAYLGQNDISLEEVEEKTAGLRIKNIWYKIKGENEDGTTEYKYFPMPLDLVQKKVLSRSEKIRVEDYDLHSSYRLQQRELNFSSSSKELLGQEILTIDEDVETVQHTFITDDDFKKYLKKDTIGEVYQFNPKSEAKIGIARSNATRTTSEGNLYRVGMLRTETVTIWVEFEGLELEKMGLLQLGAERKLAKYKSPRIAKAPTSKLEDLNIETEKQFKLYLTTPAIFKNGYYPTKIFEKAGIKVELTSCVVGKNLNIGGFDMVAKAPKEMFKAVPAGSVYHFNLISGSLADLDESIRTNNICEERGQEGFGIAFIGKI